MKEVLIILGIILLSSSVALGANLKRYDSTQDETETSALVSSNPTQATTIKADKPDSTYRGDGKSSSERVRVNISSPVDEPAPPDRGSPDTRTSRTK